MQFLAMAIREASVMEVSETTNLVNPVQFLDIGMMLASVTWLQYSSCNDCNPVLWVDTDMMLASVIWPQPYRLNDFSPVQ